MSVVLEVDLPLTLLITSDCSPQAPQGDDTRPYFAHQDQGMILGLSFPSSRLDEMKKHICMGVFCPQDGKVALEGPSSHST